MFNKIICVFVCICGLLTLSACGDDINVSDTTVNEPVGAEAPLSPITFQEEIVDIPVAKETRISFVAVGDNIPHDSVLNTAKADAQGNEKYNFSKIYAGVKADIEKADIAFINQESPVGGESLGISGYPSFNAPNEMIEDLIDVGFDVFNIANNHMYDKKLKGYTNTVDYFNSLPITMIGGYTKNDYDNVRIVEEQGIKIAFLSYVTFVNGLNTGGTIGNGDYIIPFADTDDITRQVAIAKEQADMVIVSFHWGTEYKYTADNTQKKYAKLCADLGVDAIIGHHPHVVGDVEWLEGESGNKTLVAYSIGNFCSSQLYSYSMVGEMLKFDIVKDKDGVVSIENVLVDPVVCHYKTDTSKKDNQNLDVRYEVRMYMMRDYTEALANSHGSQNWARFSFDTLKGYISGSNYADVADEFLPDFMK